MRVLAAVAGATVGLMWWQNVPHAWRAEPGGFVLAFLVLLVAAYLGGRKAATGKAIAAARADAEADAVADASSSAAVSINFGSRVPAASHDRSRIGPGGAVLLGQQRRELDRSTRRHTDGGDMDELAARAAEEAGLSDEVNL